jgi:phage shock protein C
MVLFRGDLMLKLTKSPTDKALFGVCGGIAEFFGISSFIVRLIFFLTSPVSFWVYVILVWSLKDYPSL